MKKYAIQSLRDSKHYRKKELEFDYISKSDFKILKSNQGDKLKVIGFIDLNTTNKENEDTVTITSNNRFYNFELTYLEDYTRENENNKSSKKIKKRIIGYVQVDDFTYVAVVKSRAPIIILLSIIIVSCCLLFVFYPDSPINPTKPNNPSIDVEDDNEWDKDFGQNSEDNAITETTTIPGYANLFVSTELPTIKLINPTDNTVYLKYVIKEGDTIVYETKGIKPDNMVEADLKSILTVGEHHLTFEISAYDVETMAGCNGGTQEVDILVKE